MQALNPLLTSICIFSDIDEKELMKMPTSGKSKKSSRRVGLDLHVREVSSVDKLSGETTIRRKRTCLVAHYNLEQGVIPTLRCGAWMILLCVYDTMIVGLAYMYYFYVNRQKRVGDCIGDIWTVSPIELSGLDPIPYRLQMPYSYMKTVYRNYYISGLVPPTSTLTAAVST